MRRMARKVQRSSVLQFLHSSILVTTNSTWSAQSRWECMERNAQRSSVLEFFVSYILTADLVFHNRERYHETATHIPKSPFGCFLVMHANFSSVRLSHFSSVKLFQFHVLVTDETLVFVEES